MNPLQTFVDINDVTYFAGTAYTNLRVGRLSSVFSYDADYLTNLDAYALDPNTVLSIGSWAFPQGLPPAFKDACPDRWGRNLIAKRAQTLAAKDKKP